MTSSRITQRTTRHTTQLDNKADRQRRLRYFLRGCPATLAAQIATGAVRLTDGPGGYVRFLEGGTR